MRHSLLVSALLLAAFMANGCASSAKRAGMTPAGLRCEFLVDPLGIDQARPRLSWMLEGTDPAARGLRQTAYQVIVASSPKRLASRKPDLWNTKKMASGDSIHIEYAGKPLASGAQAFWQVRVWDQEGRASAWSKPAKWSMGLLKGEDWQGKWIGLDAGDEGQQKPHPDLAGAKWIWFPEGEPQASAPVASRAFRRIVKVPAGKPVQSATCRITADNQFELFVNGQRLGSGQTFSTVNEVDIAKALRAGDNCIAVLAANVGENPNPAGLIASVRITVEGGGELVRTDEQWRCAQAPADGWQQPGFDDSKWVAARTLGELGAAPWGNIGVDDRTRLPARMLRREFALSKPVHRATVYVSGLGLYELHVNGKKIGDRVLDPGLTEYTKRAFYVTHDVTADLKPGANALGVILGNGRYYAPRRSSPINTRTYGYPKLLLQLNIEYANGKRETIFSDERWKLTTEGPILANNEYDGEEYDARREIAGWARAGSNDSAWKPAAAVKPPGGAIVAQMAEPIRVTETIRPVGVTSPSQGVYIFDMGQNMVGWCRLTVSGPAGTQVKLRHAETLKDGVLYMDNIRGAKVTDLYTLKGKGTETWEPRFTYHGFRYVEVTGFPGQPTVDNIAGCIVHDDVRPAGEFACSNDLLNRIHRNVFWGVRGNYRSFPTDCPQRDERQAWLGDRSAESKGETYFFDVAALYAKWMQDIEDAQREDGSVSDVSPAYWPLFNDNVTWPSSFIIIPGSLYEQYGDLRVIRDRYPAMRKWIRHMQQYLKDDLMPRDTYGDWCVPPESQELIHSNDPARKTPGEVLGTTYFYHDLKLMERYARLLGKGDDAGEYAALAAKLKKAFNRKHLDKSGDRYANGAQTTSVLPLAFGMVPEANREAVFKRLVEKIMVEGKGHIGTGLVGGQWLNRVLSDNGRPDVVYAMASKKTYPSWGYMIAKGATTIWELWNGDTADPAMNSHNHVMLVGDLAIWMHEYLAGIRPDPDRPAFKHILIRPTPVGDVTWARATLRTMHGEVRSAWKIEDWRFTLEITIPPNTTATVRVPAAKPAEVMESGRPAGQAPGVKLVTTEKDAAVFEVGSGKYTFSAAGVAFPGT